MKKFLLLSLAAVGLLAQPAKAITAQELDGKYAWVKILETYSYYKNKNLPMNMVGNVKFEAVGTNKVKLTNFFDGDLIPELANVTVTATISGNTFTIEDGFEDMDYWADYQGNYAACIRMPRVKVLESGNYSYWLFPCNTNGEWDGEKVSGTISVANDGTITLKTGFLDVLKFRNYNGYHYYQPYGSYQLIGTNGIYYDLEDGYESCGVEYETYVPNAIVTDTYKALSGKNYNNIVKTTNREYTARVSIDDTQITFVNFSNLGRAHTYTGTNNNKSVSAVNFARAIPNRQGYTGWTIGTHSTKAYGTGSKVYLQYLYAGDVNAYKAIPMSIEDLNYGEHIGENRWIEMPGNSTRIYTKRIKVDEYTRDWEYTTTDYEYEARVANTVITVYEDCTHKVALQNVKMGLGEIAAGKGDYLYFEGNVVPGENADYVENYELYVIPGAYSQVSGSAFNNTDKGHTNGFNIEDYEIKWSGDLKPNAISSEGTSFRRAIPVNDLKANNAYNSNGAYSIYVKTNYTEASGLEPTFHALQGFNNYTTGVEDIVSDGADMEDAPAVYYNLNGVQVDGENLTPGIYVRRQGNTATKIIVK